jgi:hypothetical protein
VLTHGGEVDAGRPWRRPAAVAAGSSTPANWQLGRANKRVWQLCGCKRKVGVARVGVASGRRVEFTVSTDERQWRLGGFAARVTDVVDPFIAKL